MIVGIDLGTTNSLIAYFTEEGPKIIRNEKRMKMAEDLAEIVDIDVTINK